MQHPQESLPPPRRPSRRRSSLFFIAIASAFLGLNADRAMAIKPLIQVEDGYPEGKGQFESENTLGYSMHTREDHSFRGYSLELEVEYGLADDFTIRAKGTTVHEDTNGGSSTHFDGGGIEAQYFFSNPNVDPIGLSVISLVEVGENTFNNENYFVVQKDFDKWTIGYNFGIAVGIDNLWDHRNGSDSSGRDTNVAIINNFGACYELFQNVKVGADFSIESDYLEGRVYTGSTAYIGPDIFWVPNDKWWFTAGVEYQVTDTVDAPRWTASLIIGYYL